ncbi:MAG: DUF3160 domain-containing protein [Candidatus Aminicenantes bacterium]|nr:DUF3160 domain-containing protein [Candidatus Aminicenantes bacterium]
MGEKMKTYKLVGGVLICFVLISGCHLSGESPKSFRLQELDLLNQLNLSETGLEQLKQNGFVVTLGSEKEMFDIYLDCKKQNHPVFITTDVVLHTAHLFFDKTLRVLEMERLIDRSKELTERMIEISKTQYQKADDSVIKEAARLNIGFFSVAKSLFEPDFQPGFNLDKLVNEELKNIQEHEGLKFRKLMSYVENPALIKHPYAYEDYSQYVPRGHYTRNELFAKYFKVLMWYGRIDFKLSPGTDQEALYHGQKMTLQALLITDALMRDKRAHQLWNSLYEPTVYFVGKTDDLSVKDFIPLIEEVYGSKKSIDDYNHKEPLSQFIERAIESRPPQILSGVSFQEDGDFQKIHLGFRFMGQRFIPDSYIFQQLVYGQEKLMYVGHNEPFTMEYIPNVGPARAFPRGLDLFAVLGSQRALDILKKQGDTRYKGYSEQLHQLKKEFSSLTDSQWKKNLYWRWIHSFLPLLKEPRGETVPDFMKNLSWIDKQLLTVLGSWTELRHDTILYAKQSYTVMGRAPMPKSAFTYGFVEPYPQVFDRIKGMMSKLRQMNGKWGQGIPEVQNKIKDFEDVLSKLIVISKKELQNRPLTKQEYDFIWNIGSTLKELKTFPLNIQNKISSSTDERIDIIADVHTDLNTKQVLEEGVGSPLHIYVMLKDIKGFRLSHGAVFSYYEFKHALKDRLTDEKWQEMGQNHQRPGLPEWTRSFISDR